MMNESIGQLFDRLRKYIHPEDEVNTVQVTDRDLVAAILYIDEQIKELRERM